MLLPNQRGRNDKRVTSSKARRPCMSFISWLYAWPFTITLMVRRWLSTKFSKQAWGARTQANKKRHARKAILRE